MKFMLFGVITLCAIAVFAFEVQAFGPGAYDMTYANLQQSPFSMGGVENDQDGIFVMEGDTWNFYPFWAVGLPIRSILNLNETTILVAMGGFNSYSDGVYNFNLNTHGWSINYWFMSPNFLKFNPNNSTYYVGEREGLFKSVNGTNWSRISSLGTSKCSSLAYYNSNIITNNGAFVKYSNDNGQSWQTADTSNLRGFYYTSSGTLYAIMDVESDSDGLWRSDDFGATWNCVYFTSNLHSVGPDFGEQLVLGWSMPNESGNYLALINLQYQLTQLIHASLDTPVRQLEIFPLVNTPSFFVLNSEGCFFVTGFLPVANEDVYVPAIEGLTVNAYPNPFVEDITIEVQSADKASPLQVNIYNLKGQLVTSLHNASGATTNTLHWDGRDSHHQQVSSGIYNLIVSQNGTRQSRKILYYK